MLAPNVPMAHVPPEICRLGHRAHKAIVLIKHVGHVLKGLINRVILKAHRHKASALTAQDRKANVHLMIVARARQVLALRINLPVRALRFESDRMMCLRVSEW